MPPSNGQSTNEITIHLCSYNYKAIHIHLNARIHSKNQKYNRRINGPIKAAEPLVDPSAVTPSSSIGIQQEMARLKGNLV